MSKTKMLSLGGRSLPVDFEAVLAGADPLAFAGSPLRFDFVYRQIAFAGRCELAGERARLKLVGNLGPLPFTAESPAARAGLVRIAAAANEALGAPRFRMAQGHMAVGGEFDLVLPVTATALVSEIVRFLLPVEPYLDPIAVYVRPPLAPAPPGAGLVLPEWRKGRGKP